MFKKTKEIKSKTGELHFERWNIISTPWFKICLHKIYKADEDEHLHNHPWNFINLVVKGSYIERTVKHPVNPRLAGMLAIRKKDQYHKIDSLLSPVVYTLNFMWGFRKEWGYEIRGKHISHEDYRERKRNKQL